MTDPLAVGGPQAAMHQDLLVWQATGPTTSSFALDDVLTAAEPLLRTSFAWSLSIVGDGKAESPIAQRVSLLHAAGGQLGSIAPDGPGAALAGLLGLRLSDDASASAAKLDALVEQVTPTAKPKSKVKPEPEPETKSEPSSAEDALSALPDDDAELSDSDRQTCLAMLKALPPDARRSFTIAFRSHFDVSDSVKQVGVCITHARHQLFVQDFIDEIELQGEHG